MWWLFYTLLAAVLWGIGQIFVKKGLGETSSLLSNILSSLLGFIIFVPFALSHGVNFEKIPSLFPLIIVVPVLFFAYFYVIGRGQLSLTGTVLGTYPFITVILSVIFLHENPSIYQKIAILLIIIAGCIIALPNKLHKVSLGSWLLYAIAGIFMIGTGDFLIKVLLNQSDLYTYLFTYAFCSITLTIPTIFIDKKGRELPKFTWKMYLPTLIGVAMIEVGFFVFHLAANEGLISLVTPISSLYVPITAVLAWFILKEKINKLHAFGITLAAIGVALVGIY